MKFSSQFINVAHAVTVGLPIVLLLTGALNYFYAFIVSAVLVLLTSVVSGFHWAHVIKRRDVLSQGVPTEKLPGLKKAGQAFFSGLWIIPKQSPFPVSDAIWITSIKRYGETVRASLVASSNSNYFVVGALSLVGFFVGFAADFGIVLTRLATATGAVAIIQVALVGLSGWVSIVYFFNGFFRTFLSRGDL